MHVQTATLSRSFPKRILQAPISGLFLYLDAHSEVLIISFVVRFGMKGIERALYRHKAYAFDYKPFFIVLFAGERSDVRSTKCRSKPP